MAPVNRKISAASARSHTRRKKQASSFSLPSGILTKLSVVLLVGLLALSYQALQPPPPKTCGSPDGPPVTSPRIKLKDGRNLSYIETGVQKEKAVHKIIFIHGFDSCKHSVFPISKVLADEFGIYMVAFDRPGYGESDPDPNRSLKSTAQDIEELADRLELGPKFFVIGFSMGGEYVWTCLKYIPHRNDIEIETLATNGGSRFFPGLVNNNGYRLAGAALVAPASNYWWPNFPSNLSKDALNQQFVRDQWAYRVAHYAPWLTYWWNTQKWFPSSSVLSNRIDMLSAQDKEILPKLTTIRSIKAQARQQGQFESVHRDANIGFGKWEFDPMDLENPFPNKEGTVQLWHGDEDIMAPVSLSRYISQKLPWVRYHELPNAGHMFLLADGMGDVIVKALVTGDQ